MYTGALQWPPAEREWREKVMVIGGEVTQVWLKMRHIILKIHTQKQGVCTSFVLN